MSPAVEKRWSVAQVELLKAQWETKNSCRWIAVEINRQTGSSFTRNAVIGKVHRMGLTKRVFDKPAAGPKQPRKRRDRRIRPERLRIVDLFASMLPPPDFLGVKWAEAVDTKACMYPEGDGANMLFCGQPRKAESSYCPSHHAICWIKPREQKPTLWRAA